MPQKFRVCAIAKDESAYLADWVFHHHYFGFNSFVVYVNRTTDKSVQILDKIKILIPELEYEVIDWIDFCSDSVTKNMQNIAYAYDIEKSKRLSVDYWLPIDIDEFWTPDDFSSKISEFVDGISLDRGGVAFPWCCELGAKQPFSELSPDSSFYYGRHVKTLVCKPWENIRRVRVHKPILCQGRVRDPSGNIAVFDKNSPQQLKNTPSKRQAAYIVHRMYRSEVEYFSMLYKPQTTHKHGLKTNRQGYRDERLTTGRTFTWPQLAYNHYLSEKEAFIDRINADELISESKERVVAQAKLVKQKIDFLWEADDESKSIAVKLTRGTTYKSSSTRE